MSKLQGAERRKAPPAPAPSLSQSINCTEKDQEGRQKRGYARKAQFALQTEIEALVHDCGIERILFITPTVGTEKWVRGKWVSQVRSEFKNRDRFEQCFRSFRDHVLCQKFEKGICIRERHKDGVIHPHILVVCKPGIDVRTGFDFKAFHEARKAMQAWRVSGRKDQGAYARYKAARGQYARSATVELKTIWRMLGNNKRPGQAQKYGFGRVESTPIEKAEAIGKYLGKYLGKGFEYRLEEDGRRRNVSCFGFEPGQRKASSQFAWCGVRLEGKPWSPRAWLWRQKLREFCRVHHTTWGGLKEIYGPKWAHFLKEEIMAVRLGGESGYFTYPTVWHAMADGHRAPDADFDSPVTVEFTKEEPLKIEYAPSWEVWPDGANVKETNVISAIKQGKIPLEQIQAVFDKSSAAWGNWQVRALLEEFKSDCASVQVENHA